MHTTRTDPDFTSDTVKPGENPASSSDRLLWLDLVRAAALMVVVLGHFLQAVVHLPLGGELSVTAFLDTRGPVGQLLWSWPLQVMAAFFAVGAFAAAAQLRTTPITSMSQWAEWMTTRVRRLVVPTIPLLTVWVAAGPWLDTHFGAVAGQARAAALVPLWFLAVYLVVQALTPLWVRLLDRHRWWTVAAGLVGVIVVIDIVRFAGVLDAPPLAVTALGFVQFPLVWSIPTVLGVARQSGWLTATGLRGLLVGALVGAGLLIAYFGYEIPVVGVTGGARSNNSPPSLLLAMHATAYAAAVLWLAPRSETWLRATSGRRAALRTASAWSMPVYLWHMTGLVVVVAVELVIDVPGLTRLMAVDPLTSTWWATRPLWIAASLVPAFGLIWATRRPTMWLIARSARFATPSSTAVMVAVLASSAGIAMMITSGLSGTLLPALALLSVGLISVHAAPWSPAGPMR